MYYSVMLGDKRLDGLSAGDSCQGIIFHRYKTGFWSLGEPIAVQKEGK